jgi:hypothetical protein
MGYQEGNLNCNGFDQSVAKQQLNKHGEARNNSESVFSIDATDAPVDWLGSDHVIYVYYMSMSVPRLYK